MQGISDNLWKYFYLNYCGHCYFVWFNNENVFVFLLKRLVLNFIDLIYLVCNLQTKNYIYNKIYQFKPSTIMYDWSPPQSHGMGANPKRLWLFKRVYGNLNWVNLIKETILPEKIDILCMQETEINKNLDHNLLSFPGFTIETENNTSTWENMNFKSGKNKWPLPLFDGCKQWRHIQ